MRSLCMDAGAFDARVANHWAKGGAGATELGQNRALKYLRASFVPYVLLH